MDEPIRPKSSSSSKTVPKHDAKKRDVKSSQKPKDSKTVKSSKDNRPKEDKPREKREERKDEKKDDKREERKDDKREERKDEPREKREEKREEQPREKREESRKEEPREKREEKQETKNEESVRIVSDLKTYLNYRDDGLVVVDFNTTWCGPCRTFAPTFEEIAKNYPGVTFLSVDAESFEHEDTSSVKSVPTFKIFLNGVLRREFSGINREKLERYIERYQIQILVNGRTQRTFPQDIKDKVHQYMDMLQPE